jgi:hypothetical protein
MGLWSSIDLFFSGDSILVDFLELMEPIDGFELMELNDLAELIDCKDLTSLMLPRLDAKFLLVEIALLGPSS